MKIKMILLALTSMVSFAGAQAATETATSKCKTACDKKAKAECATKCSTKEAKECATKCKTECDSAKKECATKANVTHYNVSGMTCGGCSKKLTTALSAVKGVEVKKVCHKSGCVDVVLSEGATAEQVQQVITKTGFKITPEKKG